MAGIFKTTLVRAAGSGRLRALSTVALKITIVGRATRWLAHRLLPKGRRVWIQIPSGDARGLWLKADPYHERRYFTGCPEPGVQEEIAKHLKPGDCFFDVGAHIGFYTLLAARLVGEKGQAIAFEPDPVNLVVLRENLARNKLPHAQVIASAVWSRGGRVQFDRHPDERDAESSRQGFVIAEPNAPLQAGLVTVNAVSLDEFTRQNPHPAFIKVDVEGAEAEVLAGAENLMATAKPVWLIEIHNEEAKTSCEAKLLGRGYRIGWLPGLAEYPFPRHLLAIHGG